MTALANNNDLAAGSQARTVAEQTADQTLQNKLDNIAEEVPIAFSYNGKSHAVMMASPTDLHDYAVGFSLTEGIVNSAGDIRNIEVNQAKHGFAINVSVDPEIVKYLELQRRQISGRSGCGVCGIVDLAAAIPDLTPLPKHPKPSYSIINKALKQFHQEQVLQRECGSVHCAAIFNSEGQMLNIKEDIGRHNALDKAIGAQTGVSKIQATDFVVISSRASHELVTKTAIAGAGSLIAVSAATSLAIDMAIKLNVNLVGFIRGERQVVYHQNND